jgi:hypothetical protein
MRKYAFVLSPVLLLAACTTTEQFQRAEPESVSDQLISALSSCDSSFFKEMARNKEHLQPLGPFTVNGGNGYFVVKDRNERESRYVMFSKALEGRAKIVGYVDGFVDIESLGQFQSYDWGFFVSGSVEEVKKAILPIVKNAKWMRRERNGGGVAYMIPELYDLKRPGYGWMLANNISSGTIPAKNTLERVFVILNGGESYPPGVTMVNCSLQGRPVPDAILLPLRPDIEAGKNK